MRRLTASTIAALLLCLACFLPAGAEEATPSAPEAQQKSAAQPATTADIKPAKAKKTRRQAARGTEAKEEKQPTETAGTPPPVAGTRTGKFRSFFASLPGRLPPFFVGTLVGTPVAWARCTRREIVIATRDLTGEHTNPLIVAPCGVLGVPAGIIGGALYGAINGICDSWSNSADHPYSKDAYSLGTLKL